MPQTTAQFANDLVNAFIAQGVEIEDAAALKTTIAAELTDWLGGEDAIPASLHYRLTLAITDFNAEMTSRYNFWRGAADGGPNGDGKYPFILTDGTEVENECLALLKSVIAKGDPGKNLFFGEGAPASGLGVEGDSYIDRTDWTLYGPKDGDGWGAGDDATGLQAIAAATEAARAAAVTAQEAAEAAETGAAGSAATATTKAGEASDDAAAAETARAAAVTAQGAAEAAETGAAGSAATATTKAGEASDDAAAAETARAAAVTAQGAAETAQAAAELARDEAQEIADFEPADYLRKDDNLAGLASAATARDNLGLGSAATADTGDFATASQGALAASAVQPGDLGTAAAADVSDFATPSSMAAAISDALDALIGGSPGALDTLNELAAAMGDDPNFATTVTNALAAKVATTRTISTTAPLAGGGDLSGNRTLSLDVVSLTEDATPDLAADWLLSWDASASAFKKVHPNKVGGSGLPVGGLLAWPTAATPAPTTPDYLALNTNYLQSSYPALFAKLGLSPPAIGTSSSYISGSNSGHRLFYGLGKWWRLMMYQSDDTYNEGEGLYYRVFTHRIDVSTDLSSWTNVMAYSTGLTTDTAITDGTVGGIAFGATQAVVAFGRHVYVSTGSTFTKYSNALPSGFSPTAVGFAAGKFGVLGTLSGNTAAITATDPTSTWSTSSSNIGGSVVYPVLVTDGTTLVVPTGQDTARRTTDWATWSAITGLSASGSTYYSNGHSWSSGFYAAGAFWLFGTGTSGSSTSYPRICKSTDGATWTEVSGASLGSQPAPLTGANQIYAAGPVPGTNWAVIAGSFASSLKVALIDLTKLGVNSNNGQVLATSTDANLSVSGVLNSSAMNYINWSAGSFLLNTSAAANALSNTYYKAPLSPDPATEFKTPTATAPTGTALYIKA